MTKQRHRQCKPLHTVWARPGQSGEAHVLPIQDDNLTAEVPLRRSILQSTLRQEYRSTGEHNPQRDGGPEKGLYRLHPIALGVEGLISLRQPPMRARASSSGSILAESMMAKAAPV